MTKVFALESITAVLILASIIIIECSDDNPKLTKLAKYILILAMASGLLFSLASIIIMFNMINNL